MCRGFNFRQNIPGEIAWVLAGNLKYSTLHIHLDCSGQTFEVKLFVCLLHCTRHIFCTIHVYLDCSGQTFEVKVVFFLHCILHTLLDYNGQIFEEKLIICCIVLFTYFLLFIYTWIAVVKSLK